MKLLYDNKQMLYYFEAYTFEIVELYSKRM